MAKDYFHDNVKKALEKDDWVVTNELFRLEAGKMKVEIDLIAEKIITAE